MLLEFRVVFSARPVLFGFGTLGWHGFGAFRLTVFLSIVSSFVVNSVERPQTGLMLESRSPISPATLNLFKSLLGLHTLYIVYIRKNVAHPGSYGFRVGV